MLAPLLAHMLPKGLRECSVEDEAFMKEKKFYRRINSLGKTLLQNVALLFDLLV